MGQQQWTVPGYGGKPFKVGLYHSAKKGHLLVYCNGKILIIDFGVTDTKDYSFMLGEELYELNIVKKGSGFEYIFNHNEAIETPHNLRREKTIKTDKRRIWAVIIVFFVLIISIIGIRFYWNSLENRIHNQLAAGEGEYTAVRIFKESNKWLLTYKIKGKLIKLQLEKEDTISALGYTLQTGDSYQARILPEHKYIYYIDWTTPSEATVRRLMNQTISRHQRLHPNLSLQQVKCHLFHAFEIQGVEGMANFFQQAIDDWPVYNTNAYLRLVRSTKFKDRIRECL